MKLPAHLHSPRLLIRPLTHADHEWFVALLTNPGAAEFMFTDAQKTVPGARDLFTEIVVSYETSTPYFLLAMVLADSGELVGVCGVSGLPNSAALELFCCVSPEHRRKGFATEALRRTMKYCSAKCGATEFMAHIDPENHRSPSLAERLGMRRVGSGPHPVDGAQSDIYSVVVAPRSNTNDG